MTRNHKAISLAMALVFCLSFLAPLLVAPQAVQAASNVTALSAPTIEVGTTNATLGTVRVEDTLGTLTTGSRMTVTLVGGNDWTATLPPGPASGVVGSTGLITSVPVGDGNRNRIVDGAAYTVTKYEGMITVVFEDVDPAGNVSVFDINFGKKSSQTVNVKSSGDVLAGITINGGVCAYTEVIIGKTGTGSTTTKGLSHPSVSSGDTTLGSIQISENIAGAIASGTVVSVTLPQYVEFTGAPTIAYSAPGGTGLDPTDWQTIPGTVDWQGTDSSGRSQLIFQTWGTSSPAGFIVISDIKVRIDEDCKDGDIEAKVKKESGPTGLSSGTAWIGVKGSFGVTCEQGAETVPDLYKGQFGVEPGTILINEGAAGSLVTGRTITAELPANCYWTTQPVFKVLEGDIKISDPRSFNTNDSTGERRKIQVTVDKASKTVSVISIEQGEIAIRGDAAEGPCNVKIAGTAGIPQDSIVSVGEIKPPVTVVVEPVSDVIIGLKNQSTGTITITEAEAGLLKANVSESGVNGDSVDGNLIIDAPEGVSFANLPQVDVSEDSDLDIDNVNVTRSSDNNQLIIPIEVASQDTPGVITVSNVTLTTNRVVPEGKVVAGVNGSAIDPEWFQGQWLTDADNNVDVTEGAVTRNVTTFDLANCVTPAPTESVTQTSGSFSLGSSIYYVNGMAKMMDVACFAQDGRLFVPQRYLGLALGIPDENIVWDAATQTATFTTLDGKVIVFTVGSNIFTVDGVEFTMDVTPIVQDDRIFLPVRFLVEALGGTVGWDQLTQTGFFSL